MPELPEVETIARILRPSLVGRTIVGARLLWERTLAEPDVDQFHASIIGQTIQDTGRRGKFLILHLSKDRLIIHLRMSGDMRVEPEQSVGALHDRLIFSMDDGSRLVFNDTRKFGRVWLVEDPAVVTGNLGPEPLADTYTPADLYRGLQTHRRQIKPLLLDQTFLAGLGNIYVDESLHRARLHPRTPSQTISAGQVEDLWRAIRASLQEGIRRNGASIDWVYRGGDFQNYFRVYQRTGQPCPTCGTPIERIIVGQRGTHFCPACQPLDAGLSAEISHLSA
jgi:formamidopyrimidine-DNA glycosylase